MDARTQPAPTRTGPLVPEFDEPAFGFEDSTRLRPSSRWTTDVVGGFLARAIARDPTNLRMHVQRVTLWTASHRREETFGALVDLFVALGERGNALRTRLLASAPADLDPGQRSFLEGRLATGLSAVDRHPPAPASILTRAVTGALDTVARIGDTEPEPATDPLAEARDYLAEGNVERARELLESALRAQPERAEVADELLTIYRHSADAGALRALRRELGDRLADPIAWNECERAITARHGSP